MSIGLTKTKRRISSIKSTQKITKAMEMVAMVKLRRNKNVFDSNKDFLKALDFYLSKALDYDKEEKTHYARFPEKVEADLYIVITSDMGLCAGYNSNLFHFADEVIRKEVDFIAPLGEKGRSHFSSLGYPNILEGYCGSSLSLSIKDASVIAKKIKEDFNSGKYRSIKLIYTHYVNSLKFEPTEITLLPFALKYNRNKEEDYCPPLFEPSPREMIHQVLERYLSYEIYGKVLESVVSEQASRRTAMENANDNADELLTKLTTEYNKARQGAITQEIVEVVSGSANQ